MLRFTLLLYFGEYTSCYVARVGLIRWAHFMLRCTLLLNFGEHTSCCVVHFCCTSVTKLHITLRTSVVLRWTHIMLRCTLLLYFGEHTSCYVAHFCCTLVNTLHVTLHISVVLRWTHFMLRCTLLLYFGEHTSCYVARCCSGISAWPLQKRVESHHRKASAKLTVVTCPSIFFPKLTSRTPSCLLTEHLPTRLWQRSWMFSMSLWTIRKYVRVIVWMTPIPMDQQVVINGYSSCFLITERLSGQTTRVD